ncbi:uncharacterized protein LOC132728180 isoform X1 [Ruditapes philippinarum]|uniref:uncharacterized protein LOC132728180 isoform X1 n=1 Tax=Ruditapes philippinarum TaxID=129788 RepID=UPI00295AF2EC|nr:uncharacterized protein LOC132728180 isoform X1 [Ruditapes philippinarum]
MKFSCIQLFLVIVSSEVISENKRLLLHDPVSIAEAIHQLRTEIGELNTTIAQLKASHAKDITEMKAKHDQEVGQLDALYSQEVANLKATESQDVTQLNATHYKDVAQLNAKHFQDVAQLNVTHYQNVAQLKAEHAKEVADLKAGLNAEKLERCRTGSIGFHHEECAQQQCSESQVIHFSPPFTKVPVVTFAFSSMDVNKDRNFRIGSSVSAVTTSSATLTVHTWADTVIYLSSLNWIACPNM